MKKLESIANFRQRVVTAEINRLDERIMNKKKESQPKAKKKVKEYESESEL